MDFVEEIERRSHVFKMRAACAMVLASAKPKDGGDTKSSFSGKSKAKAPNAAKHRRVGALPTDDKEGSIYLVERVSAARLQWVLDNMHLVKPSERTKFENYASAQREAQYALRIEYTKQAHGYGRYTSGGALLGFSRELRASLVFDESLPPGERMIDVDIVNSHFTILKTLCLRNDIHTPLMDQYLSDRETILLQMTPNRDVSKRLMLIMLYGGDPVKHLREEGLERFIAGLPKFVRAFRWELHEVSRQLVQHIGALREIIGLAPTGNENRIFSALSIYIQELETRALMLACDRMRARGWEIAVLMHDGFMVYSRPGVELSRPLLNSLNQVVKHELQLDLQFEIKTSRVSLVSDGSVVDTPPLEPAGSPKPSDATSAAPAPELQSPSLISNF
jgi:hypothetical protein